MARFPSSLRGWFILSLGEAGMLWGYRVWAGNVVQSRFAQPSTTLPHHHDDEILTRSTDFPSHLYRFPTVSTIPKPSSTIPKPSSTSPSKLRQTSFDFLPFLPFPFLFILHRSFSPPLSTPPPMLSFSCIGYLMTSALLSHRYSSVAFSSASSSSAKYGTNLLAWT